MPIKIPDNLPTTEILAQENIFVMEENRASHQDIRPLKIIILNLMPTKLVTETQLLRLLANSPLQVEVDLLHTQSHISKNTPREHLLNFYKTFEDVKNNRYDGMIITGAPVEQLPFEEVDYWEEFKNIMDWSIHNVYATLHICWGAQAGLYHHYGIPKYPAPQKIFGVFSHKIHQPHLPLLRGFDDQFLAPHSRHTEIKKSDVTKIKELDILAESDEAGIYIVANNTGRQIFVTGHSEYDPLTLRIEYQRDLDMGLSVNIPSNYFPGDDPSRTPTVLWRSHANLLFSNWLNYYVYQETPFDLNYLK